MICLFLRSGQLNWCKKIYRRELRSTSLCSRSSYLHVCFTHQTKLSTEWADFTPAQNRYCTGSVQSTALSGSFCQDLFQTFTAWLHRATFLTTHVTENSIFWLKATYTAVHYNSNLSSNLSFPMSLLSAYFFASYMLPLATISTLLKSIITILSRHRTLFDIFLRFKLQKLKSASIYHSFTAPFSFPVNSTGNFNLQS